MLELRHSTVSIFFLHSLGDPVIFIRDEGWRSRYFSCLLNLQIFFIRNLKHVVHSNCDLKTFTLTKHNAWQTTLFYFLLHWSFSSLLEYFLLSFFIFVSGRFWVLISLVFFSCIYLKFDGNFSINRWNINFMIHNFDVKSVKMGYYNHYTTCNYLLTYFIQNVSAKLLHKVLIHNIGRTRLSKTLFLADHQQ